MSIQIEYEMDENIIGLCGESFEERQKMHSYLEICYKKIVEPMTAEFKNLMIHF